MKDKFQALNSAFLRLPSAFRVLIVIAIFCAIAVGDFLTPPFISFAGFYLLPIFLSIWYSRSFGVFATVFIASLLMRTYAVVLGTPPDAPFWESILNVGSTAFGYVLFSVLGLHLKTYVVEVVENGDTDQLTGLRSRRNFLATAEYELGRRKRIRFPVSVAMLDIDNFKQINDNHGHAAGDRLLVAFSQCLQHSLRNIDIVGRLGGDEFGLVLSGITFEQTNSVLRHLHSNLKPVLDSFEVENLGCSIGAVNVKEEDTEVTIDQLLNQADVLMYQVKNSMKNDYLVRHYDLTNDAADPVV